MKQVLAEHPILVGVSATTIHFLHYSSGILDFPGCSGNDDTSEHYMLLVGWGVDKSSGEEYWLLKNSWGTQWGDQGYIRIAIADDICAVQDNPQFVNLN